MLKKLLLCYLFLNTLLCFSQDIVNSTAVELKKNRDVFQIVNDDKKEVTLFISDKIKVKALHLNNRMEIIDSISSERPDKKKYDNMIGYNTNNDNTRLYWSSSDHKQILSQLYDFDTRKIVTTQHTLPLKNEKFLQQFSSKDKFYVLTVTKASNLFNLHIFDQQGQYESRTINLDHLRFFNNQYKKTNLYGIFDENLLPFEAGFSLQNIKTENPTSITDGAKKRKCYFNENELVITLDANVDFTQVLLIDLKNFTVTEKVISKPTIPVTYRTSLNSNSFYFDKKLYQIKSSSDIFFFTIKDLEGTILKEYRVTGDTPIEFKNSEIYQQGGAFGGKRILETSSQFIRKVNAQNSGISCYHIADATLITLGSVSELQQSSGSIVAGQFGLLGVAASIAIQAAVQYYNPTMDSFNSYSNRKVVKIECLFDKDNNHITADLKPLAFDKIRTFFDNNTEVSSQTLFKMEASYYLGYYDNTAKEYTIRKFAD